jgi:hypothetical protein
VAKVSLDPNELTNKDYFNFNNVWEYAYQRAIDDTELLNQWLNLLENQK